MCPRSRQGDESALVGYGFEVAGANISPRVRGSRAGIDAAALTFCCFWLVAMRQARESASRGDRINVVGACSNDALEQDAAGIGQRCGGASDDKRFESGANPVRAEKA